MSLKKAYETSGKIFEQVSKLYQPGILEQIRQIGPEDIVVVQGTYDHIENLLDTIKIPHKIITYEDITKNNGGRTMFVNCKSYEGTIAAKTKDAVYQFVSDGGRLVTTDWALGLVSKVFPGKYKKTKESADDVVEIQCPTDLGRKFVGLNYAQCHPKWWLEGSSHIYDIMDGVTPIITSNEMNDKYGKPYIAAGFVEGKGEAIHFISHLELQRTHLRSKGDSAGLETFLEKMKISKTKDMEDAKVAELEAAYSTLNTLAYLCLPSSLLGANMKSVMLLESGLTGKKSKELI